MKKQPVMKRYRVTLTYQGQIVAPNEEMALEFAESDHAFTFERTDWDVKETPE